LSCRPFSACGGVVIVLARVAGHGIWLTIVVACSLVDPVKHSVIFAEMMHEGCCLVVCSLMNADIKLSSGANSVVTACSQCFSGAPRPSVKCKDDLEAGAPLQPPRQQQLEGQPSGVPIHSLKQPKRKLTSHSGGLVVRTVSTAGAQDQQDSESSKMMPTNTPQRHMQGSFTRPNMPLVVIGQPGEPAQQAADEGGQLTLVSGIQMSAMTQQYQPHQDQLQRQQQQQQLLLEHHGRAGQMHTTGQTISTITSSFTAATASRNCHNHVAASARAEPCSWVLSCATAAPASCTASAATDTGSAGCSTAAAATHGTGWAMAAAAARSAAAAGPGCTAAVRFGPAAAAVGQQQQPQGRLPSGGAAMIRQECALEPDSCIALCCSSAAAASGLACNASSSSAPATGAAGAAAGEADQQPFTASAKCAAAAAAATAGTAADAVVLSQQMWQQGAPQDSVLQSSASAQPSLAQQQQQQAAAFALQQQQHNQPQLDVVPVTRMGHHVRAEQPWPKCCWHDDRSCHSSWWNISYHSINSANGLEVLIAAAAAAMASQT